MKKFLVAIIVALSIAGCSDRPTDVTVINHSNKASPATIFARGYSDAARVTGQLPTVFHQAQTCEQARRKFVSTPNAVFIYNADVGIAAMNKNLDCGVHDIKPSQVIFTGAGYFKICRKAGSDRAITDGRIKFGMASVVLSDGFIRDYNNNGMSLVGVPFGGSRNVLAAVINGDIDYGFIGSSVAEPAIASGQIDCVYDTDPRADNFIGKSFKLAIPDFSLKMMIYTNSTDEKVIRDLRYAAAQDPTFNAFLSKTKQVVFKVNNFNQKDIDEFNDWILLHYNTYWKK